MPYINNGIYSNIHIYPEQEEIQMHSETMNLTWYGLKLRPIVRVFSEDKLLICGELNNCILEQ